ncbi:hypothetical protein RhiJN_18628 [Ceratobasidium sp. AG-Ba]|nr:hypothetical protein RhiJN_18628 [Ceratobasidium sp. AG-Ba]
MSGISREGGECANAKPMPPIRSTHTQETNNALPRTIQRSSPSPGSTKRAAEIGLAVARALGGNPSPRAKFFAAYADGSRVRRAERYRAQWKVQSAVQSCFPDLVEIKGRTHIRPGGPAFCRDRPNHWATLAVVERHDPEEPSFDPDRPLHVHALTISQERKGGWNTQNARFWDFEGNHPNILQKELRDGPGGNPARDAFNYLWKHVGEEGEEVDDLMAGDLTLERLEEILVKGRGGKRSRQQAELEDGEEIVGSRTREEFYQTYKCLRPLDMTKSWNSIRAYAEYTYKADAGLLPAIPVDLEEPEYREHIDQADRWFAQEVRPKGPGMRHRILVIEGETGTGKTAYARSKGSHSRMCNVWNVAALSEDADIWILDDMVSTNGKYSLKALSQYEADFTGRYQRVKTMKVRPTVILGNSRAAITKCWSDIEGEEGEAWVARNVEWVYSGGRPFFVFP